MPTSESSDPGGCSHRAAEYNLFHPSSSQPSFGFRRPVIPPLCLSMPFFFTSAAILVIRDPEKSVDQRICEDRPDRPRNVQVPRPPRLLQLASKYRYGNSDQNTNDGHDAVFPIIPQPCPLWRPINIAADPCALLLISGLCCADFRCAALFAYGVPCQLIFPR